MALFLVTGSTVWHKHVVPCCTVRQFVNEPPVLVGGTSTGVLRILPPFRIIQIRIKLTCFLRYWSIRLPVLKQCCVGQTVVSRAALKDQVTTRYYR